VVTLVFLLCWRSPRSSSRLLFEFCGFGDVSHSVLRSTAHALTLPALVAAVAAYTWDSCGTRYDRLVTQSLTFTATPGMTAGAQGTIVTKVRFAAQRAVRAWMRVPRAWMRVPRACARVLQGITDLHVPLVTGAWQIRVYELGQAHSIYNTFGDLTTGV
jgi:hypothetical protein